MDNLLIPIEQFEDSGLSVSIVIKLLEDRQRHCGIVYLNCDGEPMLLHFTGDLSLIQTTVTEKHHGEYFFVMHNIHEYRQMDIASWLSYIYPENPETIPYGLRYRQTFFDSHGIIRIGERESGLTCSTFVLSIFLSVRIILVNVDEWEVREEDTEWQKRLVDSIEFLNEDSPENSKYIERLKSEIGTPRFRPEEVTASITFPHRPEYYKTIWARGEEILKEITGK